MSNWSLNIKSLSCFLRKNITDIKAILVYWDLFKWICVTIMKGNRGIVLQHGLVYNLFYDFAKKVNFMLNVSSDPLIHSLL